MGCFLCSTVVLTSSHTIDDLLCRMSEDYAVMAVIT